MLDDDLDKVLLHIEKKVRDIRTTAGDIFNQYLNIF